MSLDEWLLNVVPVSSAVSSDCCIYTTSNTHVAYTATLLLFKACPLNCSKIWPEMTTVIWKNVSCVKAEGI